MLFLYIYVVQAFHPFISKHVFLVPKLEEFSPMFQLDGETVYVRESSPLQNVQYLHVRYMKFSVNSCLLIVCH